MTPPARPPAQPASPSPAQTPDGPLPVGRIGYLNTLPVYHPLDTGLVPHHFRFVTGPPAMLNEQMRRGILPLSAASSMEYASRPERYRLLPDLAIGSRGAVMSVLLLSRKPVERLEGERILVSSQTHTSAALLRLLLDQRFRVRPRFLVGRAGPVLASGERPAALLAIGDEALNLAGHPDYPHRLDLGQAWLEWTGRPFIFGLWLVNREALEQDPGRLTDACRTMIRAKAEGLRRMDEIEERARREGGLDPERARAYFQGLCFDLGPKERQGLELFFERLAQASIIPRAPGLDFVPGLADLPSSGRSETPARTGAA